MWPLTSSATNLWNSVQHFAGGQYASAREALASIAAPEFRDELRAAAGLLA
jgi:hypothetical protein